MPPLMGWQLSAAQWDMLTEELRLEGYPAPIQVRSHGRTHSERGRVRGEVGEELRRLGLVRAGRVEAELEAALRLLHRPARWVDSVWLTDAVARQPVRVLAARSGTLGVCALQHPDRPGATVLDIIPAVGLTAAVVGRLPRHPPGRSPGGTIALAPSPERPGGVLVSASPVRTGAERERAAVSAILDQPHARAGQITANVRDSAGRVHRSPVLRWCDNPDGRYQITVSPRHDDRSLTITPGDPHRLATTLQHLLDTLH
ncbi:MAG: ESX secretion-associated protein EspG [Pseudonocardiales bacterium]|nr:ESX secretion-associated protein EspG [Pseudonocardiales bacterium]MBV9032673.1 ESX secretion-associated protein EspG [Pseudonocardiales bacterium]